MRFDDDHVDVEAEPVRTVYDGFFTVALHTLRHRLFDGHMGPTIRRELVERGRSVCLLPYDPRSDRVLLIRQFLIGSMAAGRPPRPLQVVAGIVDAGETEEAAIRREAHEEAGCDLHRMVRAQSFLPSPGGSSERVVAFCGETDLDAAGGLFGVRNEGEDIRAEVFSAADAISLLDDGSIEAGPAVVILSWFARHREGLRRSWLKSSRPLDRQKPPA